MSVEYIMLCLLMLLLIKMININELFFIIIFLTFIVCEGVFGISILVSIIRNFGNRNLFNLFYFKI